MFQVIRSIDAGVRKATEVSLRKDAARDYRRSRQEDSQASRTGAVLSFGKLALNAVRGNTAFQSQVGQAYGQPLAPVFSDAGTADAGPGSIEVISRAVQTYGDQAPTLDQGTQQQQRLGPASTVPFDVLQRAVDGPPYYEQGAQAQSVFQGTGGPNATGDQAPVPFDVLQRAASVQAFGAEQPTKLTSFEVPEEAGSPFGREVPFDFMERASASENKPANADANHPADAKKNPNLSDVEQREVQSLKSKDEAIRQQLGVGAEKIDSNEPAASGVQFRVGPDGERYAVAVSGSQSVAADDAKRPAAESTVSSSVFGSPPKPGSREQVRASLAQEAYRASARHADNDADSDTSASEAGEVGVDARL